MKAKLILTGDEEKALSKYISHWTETDYSHCALGFENADEHGNTQYFESIWKKDRVTGKTGLRGPMPFKKLLDWQHAKPVTRHLTTIEITLPDSAVHRAYDFMVDHVPLVEYGVFDILKIAMAKKISLMVIPDAKTDHEWTCSEAVARALPPLLQVRALGVGEITYDMYAPAGLVWSSLSQGIHIWNALVETEYELLDRI